MTKEEEALDVAVAALDAAREAAFRAKDAGGALDAASIYARNKARDAIVAALKIHRAARDTYDAADAAYRAALDIKEQP